MVNDGAADIYKDDGTIDFDKPQTVAAYQAYADLQKLSPPDSPPTGPGARPRPASPAPAAA